MPCSCESRLKVSERLRQQDDAYREDHKYATKAIEQLDARTRVPHLLIELRSLGFVELHGKNVGGIYEKLDAWLTQHWGVRKNEHDLVPQVSEDQEWGCFGHSIKFKVGSLEDHNRLNDASYICGQMLPDGKVSGADKLFKARRSKEEKGKNNMGKLTMQLVQFMTSECGWTLQVCDSSNLGFRGDIREQQMKFKAPHPLNLIAPHIMIELRQEGFIEINGPDTNGIYKRLNGFLTKKWSCEHVNADPEYCDVKFSTRAFKTRGKEGENNMGLRTMELVDFMVKRCKWTMVCCNMGNFGRSGALREQQMVFRNDEFVQHGIEHVMVELRTAGYVEINGFHENEDDQPLLEKFYRGKCGCSDYVPYLWGSAEDFCKVKYSCPPDFFVRDGLRTNLGKRTLELAEFMGKHGWALLLCNGGSIQTDPDGKPNSSLVREQQIKFTKARTPERATAPLLLIQLRTDPTSDKPVEWEGHVEVCGPDTDGIYAKLDEFLKVAMNAQRGQQWAAAYCDRTYVTPVFRLKPGVANEDGEDHGFMNGESNIGMWTMRLCDFMVDHLGDWDLVVCNSDAVARSFSHVDCRDDYHNSVTAREMQLIFRHRPGGRQVFMSKDDSKPLGRPPMQPPRYWTVAKCLSGEIAHQLVPGTKQELAWMQEALDKTFKQKAARDRESGYALPDRYVAVMSLRSEHPELWDRYAKRRSELSDRCTERGCAGEFSEPRTMQVDALRKRCVHGSVGNPANQAYLLHGTNPTSAVAMLERSFSVDLTGKGKDMMFGPGFYLAESSTKADEYARDDVGGEYDGLYAMLVCRVALGRPLVVEQPGDCSQRVISGEYDHVIGDRERAMGTFREFVLFHEASLYPEYAVFYRREREGKVLTPPKRAEKPPQVAMV